MNFFILLNTKEDILKNGGKQIVAIDFDKAFFFHSIKFNGYRQLFGNRHSSNSLLCAQQKKETTDLEQLEDE